MSAGRSQSDAAIGLTQQARRNDTGEGRIRIACVDAATFRPRRIPTDLPNALR